VLVHSADARLEILKELDCQCTIQQDYNSDLKEYLSISRACPQCHARLEIRQKAACSAESSLLLSKPSKMTTELTFENLLQLHVLVHSADARVAAGTLIKHHTHTHKKNDCNAQMTATHT